MPKRDRTGKFIKTEEEGYKFTITFPPLKKIICWIIIVVIILPWVSIAFKFDIIHLTMEKIEELMMKHDKETLKKNGLFG